MKGTRNENGQGRRAGSADRRCRDYADILANPVCVCVRERVMAATTLARLQS